MRAFTQLYLDLDRTNQTRSKVALLEAYAHATPAEDAAWAFFFLIGKKRPRPVRAAHLRSWLAEAGGWPSWMIEECYERIGDLAETTSLLLPKPGSGIDRPLHQLVEEELLPLRGRDEAEQRRRILRLWTEFTREECFVWMKLLTGGFRVGVSRTLAARALAAVAGVPPATMAHRLMGDGLPTAEGYHALFRAEGGRDPGQPYPFFLASPLEGDPADLGPLPDWQVEWKWDGIRAQLLRRGGQTLLWSRGEEVVTDRYPEVTQAAESLPEGTVLDGELLGWRDEAPLSFGQLQRRINRKTVGASLLQQVPVVFMAYDLLEAHGQDFREHPLQERRRRLEALLQPRADGLLRLSPLVEESSWQDLATRRTESRSRRVEGLMLKRHASPYQAGRRRGDWWKWKVDPFSIDAVLTYAQRGHGRRASLFTDYTFGVWQDGELVTVAKAYSGLTDAEIREVDRFIRRHTEERFGPVRRVTPELVFELSFEGIRASTRHKSGVALRFPRMTRWRQDKTAAEADALPTLQALAREADADV